MSEPSRSDRLETWKEIAVYLGRSVRTARRWEAEEGLPVHRHRHRSAGSVYAYGSEIDAWRRSRSDGAPTPPAPRPPTVQAPEGPSLVVLPFRYVGPRPEDEYLADGFTDEIIAALSKVRSLRVISRTSAMTLKQSTKDAPTLGHELGVGWIVDGSVRVQGDRLRVTAQLIEVDADRSAWSESFGGSLDDVFDIQESIAERIVDSLRLELSSDERSLLSGPQDRDLEAWRCLQQARRESLRWRPDAIDRAVRLLENGLKRTGPNVELFAALGRAHLQYREAGLDLGPGPLERAAEAVRQLEGLEDERGTAAQLRGWLAYSQGRIGEAVRELRESLTGDWTNPDTLALLANCLLISGRVGQARPLIEQLLSVDPLTPLNRCMPGWADAAEGNYAAAVEPYREMFEMDPGNPIARLFYVWILALNDRRADVEQVAGLLVESGDGSLVMHVARLFLAATRGEPAPEDIDRAVDSEPLASSSDVFPRLLFQAYALCGDHDRAVHWLEIAIRNGYVNHPLLARDPTFEALHSHPRFDELLADAEARWQAFES